MYLRYPRNCGLPHTKHKGPWSSEHDFCMEQRRVTFPLLDISGDIALDANREEVYRYADFYLVRMRHSQGHWCGYINVPVHLHHLRNKDRDWFEDNISCWGGITFHEQGGVDWIGNVQEYGLEFVGDQYEYALRFQHQDLHWIGFDCGHSQDFYPAMLDWEWTRIELQGGNQRITTPDTSSYRTIQFVLDQQNRIVDQMIQLHQQIHVDRLHREFAEELNRMRGIPTGKRKVRVKR